jgi:hypothetical protein
MLKNSMLVSVFVPESEVSRASKALEKFVFQYPAVT